MLVPLGTLLKVSRNNNWPVLNKLIDSDSALPGVTISNSMAPETTEVTSTVTLPKASLLALKVILLPLPSILPFDWSLLSTVD